MTLPASGPINLAQIAAEFGLASTTPFPSGFYGKGGAPSSGPLSFEDFYGRSGTAPLTASAAPTSIYASGVTTSITTTTSGVASIAGGVAPYTQTWSKIDGDLINITSPSATSTTFTATGLGAGQDRSADFVCAVRDSAGTMVTTNSINVEIERTTQGA